jgi:hypothetical protein
VRSAKLLIAMGALVVASRCPAQELGHKLVGTLGLQAAVQPPTGLYLAEQFGYYASQQLYDRSGTLVPGHFRLAVGGVAVGASFHYLLPRIATYVSVAVSVPLAGLSATSDRLPERVALFSLADVYVQPLRLGWRLRHFDLVTGYAFYVPSGSLEPDDGPTSVSRAQWSHQLLAGATAYFDRARSWTLSALASYDFNGRKLGVDLTRGGSVQVQGGFGKSFGGVVVVGPTGYVLLQVQDDRGAAASPALVGARDRAFGLGAEVDVALARVRSQLFVRYSHDVVVATRPLGQLVLVGISAAAWNPARR